MWTLRVDYGSERYCTIRWFETEREALEIVEFCGPLGVERMAVCNPNGLPIWIGRWDHHGGYFRLDYDWRNARLDSAHSPTL